MKVQNSSIIHLVQLVPRQNQDMGHVNLFEMLNALSHGICTPLKPVRIFQGLFGSQDVDKSLGEVVKTVSVSNMLVERSGVELGQDKHLANVGIDAVTESNIDNAIFPCQGHGRLGAMLG